MSEQAPPDKSTMPAEKNLKPHGEPGARRSISGMAAVGKIAAATLASLARERHGPAAEASHLVALAAERLDAVAGAKGFADPELDAVRAMLREAKNAGHLAFLRQHGTEADYQAIGKKIARRFLTPGGKWRK